MQPRQRSFACDEDNETTGPCRDSFATTRREVAFSERDSMPEPLEVNGSCPSFSSTQTARSAKQSASPLKGYYRGLNVYQYYFGGL